MGQRFCYTIIADQYVEGKGYIPSAVFEGEPGHRPMKGQGEFASPWFWGKTYKQAEEVCKAKNEELGLSEQDVLMIIASSMRASNE